MTKLKYTVIKSRAQYNKYCKIADKLIDLEDTTREQEEELKLLTVLIEKWDADHNIFKDQDPVQLIKSLMKEHNLKAADLTRILSISKSYLSEILNYKKGLSKEVIRRLADHFKLNQEAFNREYTLKNVVKEGKREVSKIAISQKKIPSKPLNENLRLERLFREAIESHSLVEFPYQSDKDSRSRLRKVEPYLVAITDKGEIKVVGYSINDKESADQLKHYYFKKIKAGAVRVLPQKFHRLRVDPGKVYNTPTVKVVCRVKF